MFWVGKGNFPRPVTLTAASRMCRLIYYLISCKRNQMIKKRTYDMGVETSYPKWTLIPWDGNPDLGYICWRRKDKVVGIGDFNLIVFRGQGSSTRYRPNGTITPAQACLMVDAGGKYMEDLKRTDLHTYRDNPPLVDLADFECPTFDATGAYLDVYKILNLYGYRITAGYKLHWWRPVITNTKNNRRLQRWTLEGCHENEHDALQAGVTGFMSLVKEGRLLEMEK